MFPMSDFPPVFTFVCLRFPREKSKQFLSIAVNPSLMSPVVKSGGSLTQYKQVSAELDHK